MLDLTGETDEPFIPTSQNGTGFNFPHDGPVNLGFDRPNLGEGDAIAQDFPARLRIGEGVVSVALETREAGFLYARLDAPEKSLERTVNPNRDVLQNLRVDGQKLRMDLLPLRKFFDLVVVGRRLTMYLVVMFSAIQKAVVDLPTSLKRGLHPRGLRFGRIQAIF